MPGENVELIRRAYAAFNQRDLDVLVALLADDFVADMSRSVGPEAGVYRGIEGLRSLVGAYWQGFEEFVITADELIERGSVVIATTRGHGTGRASGVEAVGRGAHVWSVLDGKLVSWIAFQTRAEAMKEVGLQK